MTEKFDQLIDFEKKSRAIFDLIKGYLEPGFLFGYLQRQHAEFLEQKIITQDLTGQDTKCRCVEPTGKRCINCGSTNLEYDGTCKDC